MRFTHTNRKGFLLGFIDFFTAGLFFLFYMPFGGLQSELEEVLGHKVQPYWQAYLLGIPTLFIYTLVWMARIAEELKAKAAEMGVPFHWQAVTVSGVGHDGAAMAAAALAVIERLFLP